jgi:hypothetical protein
LSRRFVRDLGSVVGVRVRAVDDRGHHRAAGSSFAYSATCGLNLTKPLTSRGRPDSLAPTCTAGQ